MFNNRVFIYLLLTCVSIIRWTNAESETKLCADSLCKEVLFVSYGRRDHMLEDPNLVKFKKDQMVNITSFYFSAHPDFMEGKVKDENGQEKFGVFYSSFIDLIPYLLHLEESIERNDEYYEVVHGPIPNAAKRVVGKKRAVYLVKEYEGKAKRLSNFSIKAYSSIHAKVEEAKTESKNSVITETKEAENIKKVEESPEVNLLKNVDSAKSSTSSAATSTDKITQTTDLNEDPSPVISAEDGVVPKVVDNVEKSEKIQPEINVYRTISDLDTGRQAVNKTQEPIQLKSAAEHTSPTDPAFDSVVPAPIAEQVPPSPAQQIKSTTPLTHITTEDLIKPVALELPKFKTEDNSNKIKPKNPNGEDQINMATELHENNQVNMNSGESRQSTTPSSEQKETQESTIEQGATMTPLQNQEYSSPVMTESTPQNTMHVDEKNQQSNDGGSSEKKIEVNAPSHQTAIPIDLPTPPTATSPTVQENSANTERISPENINDKSHVSHSHDTENDPIKILQEEVEFYHTEDCGSLSKMKIDSSRISPIENIFSIRNEVNHYLDTLRIVLPYPLSDFDNTGILVLTFVLLFIILHFFNICFLDGDSHLDSVNKRLLHDCVTRLKEQEVVIKKSEINAANASQLVEVRALAEKLYGEKNVLMNKIEQFSVENEKLKALEEKYRRENEHNLEKLSSIQDALEVKDRKIKSLNEQLSETSSRNDELSNELTASRKNLEALKREYDLSQSEIKDLKLENEKLQNKLNVLEKDFLNQKAENVKLQNQTDEFMIIINEQRKASTASKTNKSESAAATSAAVDSNKADLDVSLDHEDNGAGSGGSVGWSDLSEADINDKAADDQEKLFVPDSTEKKRSSSKSASKTELQDKSALIEIVELKSKVRKLESECNSLRTALENEQKDKESIAQRLEDSRHELAEKRREFEKLQSKHDELHMQNQDMFSMLKEKDHDLKNVAEKLSDCETTLRKLSEEKRDLEHSLRKSEEYSSKMQNKFFHEERRLNSKIIQLEEQVKHAQSLSPNASAMGDLNLSGNSSDREFGPKMAPEFPSLWSDLDGSDSQYDALHDFEHRSGGMDFSGGSLRHRNNQKMNRSQISGGNGGGGVPSSRGSPFEVEEIFKNALWKEKRGSFRARSRSVGRQSASGRQSAKLVGVTPAMSSSKSGYILQK